MKSNHVSSKATVITSSAVTYSS